MQAMAGTKAGTSLDMSGWALRTAAKAPLQERLIALVLLQSFQLSLYRPLLIPLLLCKLRQLHLMGEISFHPNFLETTGAEENSRVGAEAFLDDGGKEKVSHVPNSNTLQVNLHICRERLFKFE
jgi:hypothetical protein